MTNQTHASKVHTRANQKSQYVHTISTKQQLTQKQVDDLVKLLGSNANLDNIEIIDEKTEQRDFFWGNEEREEKSRIAHKEASEKREASKNIIDNAVDTNDDRPNTFGDFEAEWDAESFF